MTDANATGVDAAPSQRPSVSAWNNWLTAAGLAITVTTFVLLVTFVIFQFLFPSSNPYVSIIGILILPSILVGGLAIVPLGIFLRIRKLRRIAADQHITYRLPRIDLNDPRQRRWLMGFVAITFFVTIPVLSASSYYGYHYTDSTEFCAKVCHTVMEPQGTVYERSPHARVTCAECHIGAGASWFVKSKLSGTRQVFKVMLDSFSRPIPPAITELRPARETCEECHWPAKFFGNQLREVVRFSPDELNTKHTVRILLKTGGGDVATGRAEGIHMHMALARQIEYVATDHNLQDVPWVSMIDDSGRQVIYRSDGKSSADPRPEGVTRQIDCMDCHNRAAHNFQSPQESIDLLLNIGHIDPTLPWIKREAVSLLDRPYPDVPAAMDEIRREITAFYRDEYPDVWSGRQAAVEQAITAVQEDYRRNFFPLMNVDWKTYPDNIGHLTSSGCFRCHDGRHVTDEGVAISSDCHVCHTFFNPVEGRKDALLEGEFVHSMNLMQHGNLRCEQCHTGGALPLCRDCHGSGEWLGTRDRGQFVPHESARGKALFPAGDAQ